MDIETPRVNDEVLNGLTEKIIGAAFKVSNALGCGFLEKVYENSLRIELEQQSLFAQQQHPVPIFYSGIQVGDYYADLIVERLVIVELKAQDRLIEVHQAQCINYLKATKLPICLLMNFNKPKVEVKRLRL